MSAKVLAKISPEEPWGTVEPVTLAELAAERAPVHCGYCWEPIVHDGDIWRHVRTGLSAHHRGRECRPLCKYCGGPATRAIGGSRFDGSGIRFMVDHFLCATCPVSGSGCIEHLR